MKKVIVGGASGFIGQHLVKYLQSAGWTVVGLSRKPKKTNIPFYQWDPGSRKIDSAALKGCTAVINLSGAGIVDKAWSSTRKQTIIDSRVKSNAFIDKLISDYPEIKTFISASAVGIYGDSREQVDEFTAISPGGFLVESTRAWENSFLETALPNVRKAAVRIGLVLGKDSGAYPPLIMPLKFGIASYFRPGTQHFPWIHIEDLCRMFVWILESDQIKGPINGVGPNPVDAQTFIQIAKKELRPWAIKIGVPQWFAKILLGERSVVLTQGANVIPTVALDKGFTYTFEQLDSAIRDLGF